MTEAAKKETAQERFMAKVKITPTCWFWVGPRAGSKKLYGEFYSGGKRWLAHRWIYTEVVGAIGGGLHIDHLCRVAECVNPSHLQAVSPRENTLRGFNPVAVNARKQHCPKGHPYDEDNTYVHRGDPQLGQIMHRLCRACRREVDRRRYAEMSDEEKARRVEARRQRRLRAREKKSSEA